MSLIIHTNIQEKLKYFYINKKIPNIVFHGPSGSGKSKIIYDFITLIFNKNKDKIKEHVMYVNCAHGKGIKFIREELKFFAKKHININNGETFKFIILLNADNLTIDAQSALRRCIELFSHNTRFFIIVEDKYKLLKPILSRFSEIYVPHPYINNKSVNLYKYNIENNLKLNNYKTTRLEWIKKELKKSNLNKISEIKIITFIKKLYEKGYNSLDIIQLVEKNFFDIIEIKKYELLITFNKIKKEIRDERILILFLINFIYLDRTTELKNITFI
jgi:DNA polymerase III delta prime subunit